MSNNKTYRIRTEPGLDKNITINLDQNYDVFEILSLKLGQSETYRLHDSNYGVIVGRVMANNGFGVENAKVSIFISADSQTMSSVLMSELYPYTTTSTKNSDGVKYNLLTDKNSSECHQAVGTFPNKSYLLDNDILLEIFDTYYKYTARTNRSGDYMLCGIPVGNHTLHMDFDISDCGILSQRPRDLVYQGYTIEQFQNPNQFKTGKELSSLSQIFSQDTTVNVNPFWGNTENGNTIGITRADINISYTFTPTCVFLGSIVGDNASNGISKKCIPTENMGLMEELVTGEGRIEMIRKTVDNDVEEFEIKGTELINGDGVWCYQIPMNLDYVKHDEYGNIVPTNDPSKGIPTRARVRFRISMNDFEEANENYFRAKVLVPNNPKYNTKEDRGNNGDDILDYNFGSLTDENSFRDLFWNNVYTVKSYIPRFQKSRKGGNWRDKKFTGIKACNIYGTNNPMPYNNIRIKLPLQFIILCAMLKMYVRLVAFLNNIIYYLAYFLGQLTRIALFSALDPILKILTSLRYVVLADGLCPDLENWMFAPGGKTDLIEIVDVEPYKLPGFGEQPSDSLFDKFIDWLGDLFTPSDDGAGNQTVYVNLLAQTYHYTLGEGAEEEDAKELNDSLIDKNSIDTRNGETETICMTGDIEYLISCIEMNLAQEYKVINFDFYNDWINGVIYMPRWAREVTKKRTYLFGLIKVKSKIKACTAADSQDVYSNEDVELTSYKTSFFERYNRYTQQCTLAYNLRSQQVPALSKDIHRGCSKNGQRCHKSVGMTQHVIFGKDNGGAVHVQRTMQNQLVYYFKPCEWVEIKNSNTYQGLKDVHKKINLFANDLVLLGSLNDCNTAGIGQAFRYLSSTSYKMPTNLALTNMDSNGVLYGSSGNTYCGGVKTKPANDEHVEYYTAGRINIEPDKVELVEQTFRAEKEHYDNQNEDGEKIEFADYDEYVPLTEAAGISWNYNGPDQGVLNDTDSKDNAYGNWFYQPGGHFLGLSCAYSETNLKSCINLSRVCEGGVSFSQRHEMTNGVTATTENGKTTYDFRYKYYIPTGLISRNDIVVPDFRTMFATMNHNKLIATTVDEETGYSKYKYTFLRPDVFGGEFDKWVKAEGKNPYNIKVQGHFQSKLMELDPVDNFLIEAGTIGVNADPKEANELKDFTFRRTIEKSTQDYWKFRLGVDDLSDLSSKFIIEGATGANHGDYSLPQFENSFYFYFGLKPGSTAIDEFNKQFFAECKNKVNDEI